MDKKIFKKKKFVSLEAFDSVTKLLAGAVKPVLSGHSKIDKTRQMAG